MSKWTSSCSNAVKPDASPDEVKAVVDDDQGGQIFSQALMNSNRYGEARSAYREVQERHADIKKIERTLTELAQLFNDVSISPHAPSLDKSLIRVSL